VTADVAKAAALLFLAAVIQVSLLSTIDLVGATPDLLLVTLLSVALLRGSLFGAVCGFAAGLVVDTAQLQTLGLTSLLYTVGAYWIGRYGETTGRDRGHAPFLSVGVVTILYAIGALLLHYLLGEGGSARAVLVTALVPSLFFNLLLTAPAYALVRRLLPAAAAGDRAQDVRLLG
jgi:rod shape-determining protein MreD